MDNDRSVTTGKMYPIDLAPQKITIVKSITHSEVKMAHLMSSQPKNTGSSQLGPHSSAASGMMRPGLAQILSPNASSQVCFDVFPFAKFRFYIILEILSYSNTYCSNILGSDDSKRVANIAGKSDHQPRDAAP